jgi:biotin operon repressor
MTSAKEVLAKQAADLPLAIRKLITKRPMSEVEIAEELNCKPTAVRKAVKELKASGANVSQLAGQKLFLHSLLEQGGSLTLRAEDRGDGWTVLGFTTDNHLCNKHERLDVLNAAYDVFEREGVKHVLNAGNWVEGEARFNRQELIVAPGMDPQLDYWIDRYPLRKGITTHYVTGDDHEGWWIQRECINVGEYAQMKAERAGRTDLHYLGHVESDVRLSCGKGSAVARLMHPGGGSAYALSYAPQKLVESFQGGEKPAILFIGHYHKWDYCYPREVHCISGGCTVDQTAFLRKNKIAAHVGFSLIKIKQDPADGHITRLSVEWNPRYDRKFYEKRFD